MADLVSRKPKPDSYEESPAVALTTIALEYKPSPEEEKPSHDETAVDRSAESESEAQVEASPLEPDAGSKDIETAAAVATDAPAGQVGDEEPVFLSPQQTEEKSPSPTLTEAAETLVKRAPARRNKINPAVEPVVSTTQSDEVTPAVAAGPKSFAAEMANLDVEVVALRRQLAKKLIEQNAQLRKMLTRFDGR
ncbi:hypothetical protein J2X76_005174 [Neorhizobium sp. 2083]|uniref:hypothetical protein n=1 Tax=Neorhizobium sp. 2083 TaxID=2817762 RepID=UPI0028541CDF|nr:hypothetical protein [Neorhizobium sp. 2083]MDR6819977.1 hypothetical protein [Neorhizobium sp. 2083]